MNALNYLENYIFNMLVPLRFWWSLKYITIQINTDIFKRKFIKWSDYFHLEYLSWAWLYSGADNYVSLSDKPVSDSFVT